MACSVYGCGVESVMLVKIGIGCARLDGTGWVRCRRTMSLPMWCPKLSFVPGK